MHKDFYASGFIFHSPSQQILLQQQSSAPTISSPWFLFENTYLENEEPEASFKDIIFKSLDITINTVQPIYSYFNETNDKFQYVVYSKLRKFQNFSAKNGYVFEWFSFKEVIKLKIAEQTKHDIIVGQRVIEATDRKSRGEHTFQ